ncbi:MAG TPA: GtrA family protein [Actinocrinis sp.]
MGADRNRNVIGGLADWLVGTVRRLWREMVGFSAVGIVGVICDITTFNVVIGILHAPKVDGSVAGTSLGTLTAYLGNRFWVFRKRGRRQSAAEIALFLAVSAVGLLFTAGCVAFNEYVLGYKSLIAANIAQFIFGQGIGSVLRFVGMHLFVFPEHREEPAPAASSEQIPGLDSPRAAPDDDAAMAARDV